ncbi:MAG TPA: DUF397 domain-containing protein [Actinophytocola sp.]|uniref:DUF397 domain-containing protein n=1 Tax=Actinophytocola sp. TaxID=1872138 RepID=UPI002F95B735
MTLSDLTAAEWRKSSRSGSGNDCVELVVARIGAAVRDSKSPETGHLAFGGTGWNAFLSNVKTGRLGDA